jgi:hypothetical protein
MQTNTTEGTTIVQFFKQIEERYKGTKRRIIEKGEFYGKPYCGICEKKKGRIDLGIMNREDNELSAFLYVRGDTLYIDDIDSTTDMYRPLYIYRLAWLILDYGLEKGFKQITGNIQNDRKTALYVRAFKKAGYAVFFPKMKEIHFYYQLR